ncbi:MAG: hypothetical protein NTX95_06470 [Actinobacteria bacterium]|nr:hypothetical protein [Actinomycetota bacterium]
MSTRVIARRYTLEVPEPAAPGCTVWRGRDSTNGGAVVVSLLDEHPEADTTLNALVAVRHPALPVVLDHGVDGVTRYVVTPARTGQSARARLLVGGPLAAADAAEVAAEIADALAALHARGLVQGQLNLDRIVADESGPLRLEDLATGSLARPADQPDDDLRQLAAILRDLLGLPVDANPLEVEGIPPRLAGLLQSLASFTPPPASDARDALRRIAREETPEWEPFAADAAPAPAGPVLSGLDEGPAPTRNRGLKLVVGALVIIVIVLAAIVIVDRRDADQRAAQTALPGPISYVTETSDTGTSEGATITETTTTEPQPVGPNRTPRALRIASVTALDPTGDNTENNDQVRLAIDGSPTTGWSTEIYKEGVIEKKRGVGLSLHLAVPSRVRRLAITSAPVGATVVIYGVRGAVPAKAPRDWIQLTDPKELKRATSVIPIRRAAPLTDVLIWITGLPPVKGGYAVAFNTIRLTGVPTGA